MNHEKTNPQPWARPGVRSKARNSEQPSYTPASQRLSRSRRDRPPGGKILWVIDDRSEQVTCTPTSSVGTAWPVSTRCSPSWPMLCPPRIAIRLARAATVTGAPASWHCRVIRRCPDGSFFMNDRRSRRLFGQEACEGLFALLDCLCHALKKDGRALHRVMLAGTIDFPPPGFERIPSPLHDERIVGWIKLFTHASLDGGGRPKFQTSVDIWLGRKVRQVPSAVHKLK